MEALKKAHEDFRKLGATFVAISPQTAEHSRALAEEKKLPFDLLVDEGNAVAREYGLVFELPDYLREVYKQFDIDLPEYNGDESWTLPMPARYIVDREGVIRDAEVSPDYTERPEPEDTVEALRKVV